MELSYVEIILGSIVILFIIYLQWFKPNTAKKNNRLLWAFFMIFLFLGYSYPHINLWKIIVAILLVIVGAYEDYRRNKGVKT